MRWLKWTLVGTLLLLAYAVAIEPFRLVVSRYDVQANQWPKERAPLNIVLLSDIHAARPWMTPHRIASIVAKVNALNPDVILLAGDFVGTHPLMVKVRPETVLAELEKLRAPCGVYAVPGNHDIDPRAPGWLEALRRSAIPLLENQHRIVDCHGAPMAIAGLADQWRQTPDIMTALAGTETSPTLLMMHSPDLFPEVPDHVALAVAGHTHGGQVALPFIGPLLTASAFGKRYARGVITEAGRTLVVSSGLGMSILPIRLGVPPEITVITLKSATG